LGCCFVRLVRKKHDTHVRFCRVQNPFGQLPSLICPFFRGEGFVDFCIGNNIFTIYSSENLCFLLMLLISICF